MAHNGKTFTVAGTHLTVAPSQDGRLAISVGASTVHLDRYDAHAFLEAAGDVAQDVFERRPGDDAVDPPAPDGPDEPPVVDAVVDSTAVNGAGTGSVEAEPSDEKPSA